MSTKMKLAINTLKPIMYTWQEALCSRVTSLRDVRLTGYDALKSFVGGTLGSLDLLLLNLPQVFDRNEREQFNRHEQDWQEFFERIDSHAPPQPDRVSMGSGSGGKGPNEPPDGPGGDDSQDDADVDAGGNTGNRRPRHGEAKRRTETRASVTSRRERAVREAFHRLVQLTGEWVAIVIGKIEAALPHLDAALQAAVRQAIEILRFAWDWFKRDGIRMVLTALLNAGLSQIGLITVGA